MTKLKDIPGKGLATAWEMRRNRAWIGLNLAILAILGLPGQHQSLVRRRWGARSVCDMTSFLL